MVLSVMLGIMLDRASRMPSAVLLDPSSEVCRRNRESTPETLLMTFMIGSLEKPTGAMCTCMSMLRGVPAENSLFSHAYVHRDVSHEGKIH